MKKARNLYKNRLGIPWMGFVVATGLVVLGFGSAWVYLQNQQVMKEDTKLELRRETEALVSETESLRNRVLLARSPRVILQRIEQYGSALEPIPSGVVEVLGRPGAGVGDAGGSR